MMNTVIKPKNIPINLHFMTFFNNVASDNDKPTTAIMKASAVPTGMPFATKTSITGTIPAALAYMGAAKITEKGTFGSKSNLINYGKAYEDQQKNQEKAEASNYNC